VASRLVEEIRLLASSTAERHEVLANPFRVLLLYAVSALGEAKWSDVKVLLEEVLGGVNPNTLSFHLKRLIDAGWIVKTGSPEDPRYTVNLPDAVRGELEEGVGKVKRILEAGGRHG